MAVHESSFYLLCIYFGLFKTMDLSSSLCGDFVGGEVTGYQING